MGELTEEQKVVRAQALSDQVWAMLATHHAVIVAIAEGAPLTEDVEPLIRMVFNAVAGELFMRTAEHNVS